MGLRKPHFSSRKTYFSSIPIPRQLVRIQKNATAHTRRMCVNILMRASVVPVVRPVAEHGFRRLFDAIAPDWQKIRADPTYRAGFNEALNMLPRNFKPTQVLDVACGTGLATSLVLSRWPQVTVVGTDISPRMIELASELVPNADFQVASVHHLPFTSGEFDLVTILDGLVDPPELLRVLSNKGRVLIVYSKHGTTPISRPLTKLATEFESLGAKTKSSIDGEAHVLMVRRT